MPRQEKDITPNWILPVDNEVLHSNIISEFHLHPVTAQVLVSRKFSSIDDIYHFLYAKLPNLHDPALFIDMDKAIQRIDKAFKNHENILIYGDNDVDGIAGTTLLVDFFQQLGANVFYYVPNRNSLNQSILLDALEYAKNNNCTLLITVDCGITAASEIEELVKHNVDVIITDHHEPTARVPHCIATLNPKLLKSTYPNREITGVGVAFKLAHALTHHFTEKGPLKSGQVNLKEFLDLVALGTISDMGSLQGENRIIVRYGLKQLLQTKRIGLAKLLAVCEVPQHKITTMDIASKVAPRLNSLGRIADPRKGVDLLLLRDPKEAEELATELDLKNTERQKIERRDSEDVEKFIAKNPKILEDHALVLHSKKWHPGIIPIIAARIAKQYNRPTIIIAIENGVGKGSIRTIPEFPILNSLHKNKDLLINFGGHDFAAGLTIDEKNIEQFKEQFIASANYAIKPVDLIPKLHLDGNVHFKDLTFDFLESISLLEPFGTDNPAPILYAEVKQTWAPKVIGKTHLKLYLEQDDRMLEGIGFGMGHKRRMLLKPNLKLKIAFTPQENNFLNKSSIQLLIRDFQIIER